MYLAQKIGTDEPHFVAIKQFHTADPHQSRLAVKEQRIWEGLDHPNVVKYEGCFIADDGGLNLVVEYIDGWSLARHLSRFSAFPEDLVAEITRQVNKHAHIYSCCLCVLSVRPISVPFSHRRSTW